MVAYRTDEMVGITELTKSLGKYLDIVTSNTLNKLAIVRRNRAEAVIVPIAEYEHMRVATDYLENLEIAQVIKERVLDAKEDVQMIGHDELLESLRKLGRDV